VFTVSGGTSLANWVACAAALEGARKDAEVIVERPTYEPLLRIPEMFACRVRRLDRRFADRWAIDLDRFSTLVTARTRLAIVTNLHNPSGARIDEPTLAAMAALLARVGATLLVDEVYLECEFGERTASCVHAGPNVITTCSLTKAYGLDGLRAGWLLGPSALVRRAARIHDMLGANGVAPGERMQVAAFGRLPALRARAHALLDPNLERLRDYFVAERRLTVHLPPGGNVAFPRLPASVSSDRLADLLRERYSTLVVPGRFFEMPRHIRISFGMRSDVFARGLRNLSRALDELGA
jgi:aspartate/methionine/tyrosine aminotransferase